jgi:hypothetical protein
MREIRTLLLLTVALTTATATSTYAGTVKSYSIRVASADSSAPKAEGNSCRNVCPRTGKCLDTNR